MQTQLGFKTMTKSYAGYTVEYYSTPNYDSAFTVSL